MRIAHLIMVHKNSAQVEWLIRALAHRDVNVYLHLDKSADLAGFAFLAKLPRVQFIQPRVRVHWASFRFTEAILAGVRQVLASSQYYDAEHDASILDVVNRNVRYFFTQMPA